MNEKRNDLFEYNNNLSFRNSPRTNTISDIIISVLATQIITDLDLRYLKIGLNIPVLDSSIPRIHFSGLSEPRTNQRILDIGYARRRGITTV